MHKYLKNVIISFFGLAIIGCGSTNNTTDNEANTAEQNTTLITQLSYFNVQSYKHDAAAFTEGLYLHNGKLIESTGKPDGQKENSKIIIYDLESNSYKDSGITLKAPIFGEGSIILNGKIYWLTYKEGTCYVYDEKSYKLLKTFNYQGEGWGMTTDGSSLIMSDGTNVIKFLNPENFEVQKTLNITYQGIALSQINELEWVENYIYANVFEQKIIVKINAQTGEVEGSIDLSQIANEEYQKNPNVDVLNGIAYNTEKKTFLITGKYWSKIYEIGLK